MNGQWMGEFKGSYGGVLIVNIDERLSNYEGLAYVLPLDKKIPMSALQFETESKSPDFKLKSYTPLAIHPHTGAFATWENISAMYPGMQMSASLDVQGAVRNNELVLDWKTNIGVEGHCALPRSKAATSQPSDQYHCDSPGAISKPTCRACKEGASCFAASANRGGFGLPIIGAVEATFTALCSMTCLHFIGI